MLSSGFEELDSVYDDIERVKKLSDSIIKIGPINVIGLDGILALIPVPIIGTVYSVLAGLYIFVLAIRGRASLGTLFSIALILLIDSGVTTAQEIVKIVPVLGPFINLITGGADALFQGHLYAAHLVQKEMQKTHFVDDQERAARLGGRHKDYLAAVKATKGKSRLVYLK